MSRSKALTLWSRLYSLENNATSVQRMHYWRAHRVRFNAVATKAGWF